MKAKVISPKEFQCDKCQKTVPAYYIDTNGVKGLYVQCPTDGTHARPYVPDLDLPYKVNKQFVNKKSANSQDNKRFKPHQKFKTIIIDKTPLLTRKKIVPI